MKRFESSVFIESSSRADTNLGKSLPNMCILLDFQLIASTFQRWKAGNCSGCIWQTNLVRCKLRKPVSEICILVMPYYSTEGTLACAIMAMKYLDVPNRESNCHFSALSLDYMLAGADFPDRRTTFSHWQQKKRSLWNLLSCMSLTDASLLFRFYLFIYLMDATWRWQA